MPAIAISRDRGDMTSIILTYPVVSIDGDLLVDSGTEISLENIESIVPPTSRHFPHDHFLSYGHIKQDLLDDIALEPYRTIFNAVTLTPILDLIGRFELPRPVIQTIYHFRAHDWYTYRHFLMVLALTTLLSREMIHDQEDLIRNVKAGTSHDIGKICIPGAILKKETALTRLEKEELKQHTVAGFILLRHYFEQREPHIALAALNHHERKDGSGYPFQVRLDDDIADIIVVSDVFDALISSRPYRHSPYSTRSALDEVTAMAVANKISMDVVRALINFTRGHPGHYTTCDVSMDQRGAPPQDNLYGETED